MNDLAELGLAAIGLCIVALLALVGMMIAIWMEKL